MSESDARLAEIDRILDKIREDKSREEVEDFLNQLPAKVRDFHNSLSKGAPIPVEWRVKYPVAISSRILKSTMAVLLDSPIMVRVMRGDETLKLSEVMEDMAAMGDVMQTVLRGLRISDDGIDPMGRKMM